MTNVIENLLVNSYNEKVRNVRRVRNMKILNDFSPLCAKVTSKGQITIPKEVRDKLNIKEGEIVSFYPNGDLFLFGDLQSIWNKELDDAAKSKGFSSWKELEDLIEQSREETLQKSLKDQKIVFKK